MLKISLFFLVCFFSRIYFSQDCEVDQIQVALLEDGECNYDPWIIVFEDEFEKEELDFSKWTLPFQCVIRNFSFSHEKQWYANKDPNTSIPYSHNIVIENGLLKLTAQKENPAIQGSYISDFSTNTLTVSTESFKYSSAEIDSRYKFGYGKFEIRCKIPKGKGFWPAFWMYGENSEKVNNEIDVFEFWDESTTDHNMTQHYNGKKCMIDYNGPDYSLDFHVFTVEWDNYKIVWSEDGDIKRTTTKFINLFGQILDCNSVSEGVPYMLNRIFPRDPMNIIANLAIEHSVSDDNEIVENSDIAPNLTTPFPSSLEIDYIRYYKKMECLDNLLINNTAELNLSPDIYNVIYANNVTFDNSVYIGPNQQLTVLYSNELVIDQGSIDFNSNFESEKKENLCDFSGLILNNPEQEFERQIFDENDVKKDKTLDNQIINKNYTAKLTIIPNPATDKILISNLDKEILSFEIIDCLGLQKSSHLVNNKEITVNISSLSNGVYFVNFHDKNKNVIDTKKIIKI
jgi:hypothetical protein